MIAHMQRSSGLFIFTALGAVSVASLVRDDTCSIELVRDACFWLFIAATAFNPYMLLGEECSRIGLILYTAPALAISCACIVYLCSPSLLFEWGWKTMIERYSVFSIAVFGSAILHVALTLILNLTPMLVQFMPHLQRYKIQNQKAPPSMEQWKHVFVHIAASQLLVQLPLITGQYFFIQYFNIPVDYASIPGPSSLIWRLVLALIIDDTWVYFGHRALHDKRIYKHIHKVHHTYTSPFAPDAEYEHPVETVVLGIGFFTACLLLTSHLLFMWLWLYVRLIVTYDSHSGYDLPFNILHLIPFYNGAREHDWHHQYFNGMYAPTFVWWDRLFGTNAGYLRHEQDRLAKQDGCKSD